VKTQPYRFKASLAFVSWFGLFVVVPSLLSAQTLAEAVKLGLESSPTLQADRMRLNGTRELQVQANNLRRPSFQIVGSTSLRENASLSRGTYNFGRTEPAAFSMQAIQPLMLGGRYQAALREADLRVAQSIARIRARELTVVRQIIEAYATVRRDYFVAEIRDQSVVSLSRQLTGAQLKRREGLVGLTEVSQVETRLALAQAQVAASRARLQQSRATLERLLGSRPIGLTEDELISVGIPDTLTGALETALQSNYELKAVRFNEDIARAVARRTEVENAPRVNLQASLDGDTDGSFNGSRSYDAQIGARVVIPLWNSGQSQSRTRAAIAEASASRLEANGAERTLTEQVIQAWAARQGARDSMRIAEELVRAAQAAQRGTQLEFDVGLRSIIEVLNQEQELQDAQVNFVTSRSNLMITEGVLATLIGVDPTGTIKAGSELEVERVLPPRMAIVPGRPSNWEKPLIGAFDAFEEIDRSFVRPVIQSLKTGLFGPEQ
jgi:outer membrane protein